MCCRKGWHDLSNGCDGTLGIEGRGHVCVATPTGAPRPVWMTSLTGTSSHWSLAGINSFRDSTETGFNVRLVPGKGLQQRVTCRCSGLVRVMTECFLDVIPGSLRECFARICGQLRLQAAMVRRWKAGRCRSSCTSASCTSSDSGFSTRTSSTTAREDFNDAAKNGKTLQEQRSWQVVA